jgi:hypothetical protein
MVSFSTSFFQGSTQETNFRIVLAATTFHLWDEPRVCGTMFVFECVEVLRAKPIWLHCVTMPTQRCPHIEIARTSEERNLAPSTKTSRRSRARQILLPFDTLHLQALAVRLALSPLSVPSGRSFQHIHISFIKATQPCLTGSTVLVTSQKRLPIATTSHIVARP